MSVSYEDGAVIDSRLNTSTEYAAAGVVLGALLALWLIRRGFGFGVGIPGIASVNVGR